MKESKNNNKNSGIDFTSDPIFKKLIRKSKWKQILLYAVVSTITLVACSILVYGGSQYLTNKKIEQDDRESNQLLDESFQKGVFVSSSASYHHNLFSAIGKRTFYKQIGDREIVWDTETKHFPAIGDVEVIDRGSGFVHSYLFNKEANRVVRYNEFNNERLVDFYYSDIPYDFLPDELNIATELDDNMLVEVGLSFKEPMLLNELGEKLGYKNVNWLWVDKKNKEERKNMEKDLNTDSLKVKAGENAHGYSVSEDYLYDETGMENIKISGAVVSGTPKELQRFVGLDIIRASVLGATIDKY